MAKILQEMLKTMVAKGASDLHISGDQPPMIRIVGVLRGMMACTGLAAICAAAPALEAYGVPPLHKITRDETPSAVEALIPIDLLNLFDKGAKILLKIRYFFL